MSPIPSVLVIDDNADAMSALAELLTALGSERIRAVPSAEEALEILKSESFSIILSDYRLEGMNGGEFLERLRSSGNRTPVVLLSGAPETRSVIRASGHDRVDFFPKPFRIHELSGAMERLLAA